MVVKLLGQPWVFSAHAPVSCGATTCTPWSEVETMTYPMDADIPVGVAPLSVSVANGVALASVEDAKSQMFTCASLPEVSTVASINEVQTLALEK